MTDRRTPPPDVTPVDQTEPPSGVSSYADVFGVMSEEEKRIEQTKNTPMGEQLRAEAAKPLPGETEEERFRRLYGGVGDREVGTGEGILRSVFQGNTMGAGEEITAMGAAFANQLMNRDPGQTFGSLFDIYLARERDRLDRFRKDSPVLAYGSEMAGALPTMAVPALSGGRLYQTGSLGQKVMTGMGTGALGGGLYGYNTGEGGVGPRAEQGGYGAILGGASGGTLPAIGTGMRKGLENVSKSGAVNAAAKRLGMHPSAYRAVQEVAVGDDALGAAGARSLSGAGPDALTAELGPGLRAQLDAAMQSGGTALRRGTEAVLARTEKAMTRFNNRLDDLLGTPEFIGMRHKAISKETAAAREAAYKRAYQTPIDYASDKGRAIETVLERVPPRIGNRAINEANELMIAEHGRRQYRHIMFDEATGEFLEMPNVQQLDYIKRALQKIGMETDPRTMMPTHEAALAKGLGQDLRDAVTNAVPAFRKAVKLGGDKVERDIALNLGKDLLKQKTTREEVMEGVQRLSDEGWHELRRGIRHYVDELTANVRNVASDQDEAGRALLAAYREMTSKAARQKLHTALGPYMSREITREINRAGSALGLKAATARNTATAPRLLNQQAIKEATEEGIGNLAQTGHPVKAGRELLATMLGAGAEARKRTGQKINQQIVDTLTSPNPRNTLFALNAAYQPPSPVSPNWQYLDLLLRGMRAPAAAGGANLFSR